MFDGSQQDAHEFYKNFIQAMETVKAKMKSSEHQHIDIGNFFMAQINTEIKCLECRVVFNNKSSVGDFIVDVIGMRSVRQAMEKFFEGDLVHDYKCVKCMKTVLASKTYTLLSTPNCLCVVLNRIPSKHEKDSRYIEINQELVLKCFDDDEQRYFQYKMMSVINHVGPSYDKGHYTTAVRYEGTTYIFDDSRVVAGCEISTNNAYILFYERTGVIYISYFFTTT